jgi:hypothetical protein
MKRIYANHDLVWRGNNLCLDRRVLVTIVPDARYPGMWRVRVSGKLSDMVNISRARDAARSLAMLRLNEGMQETPSEASPMRFSRARASSIGNKQKRAQRAAELEI